MSKVAPSTRAIVVERYLPHAPEKIWRALTEGPLLERWLMTGDFIAIVDHRFTLRADPVPNWNGIVEGEVLEVEPYRRLVYSWHSSGAAADGLKTVVTWTLEPRAGGTFLHMKQAGFRPQDEPNYLGATEGWQRFAGRLERLLDVLADDGGGAEPA